MDRRKINGGTHFYRNFQNGVAHTQAEEGDSGNHFAGKQKNSRRTLCMYTVFFILAILST